MINNSFARAARAFQARDVAGFQKLAKLQADLGADYLTINIDGTQSMHVTPEDNPTSQSIKSGGADSLKSLKTLKGAAFDTAYIEHEIAYHAQVIEAVKGTLIPNAQNDELKQLLMTGLTLFEGHLEHAKQIQTSLGK